MPDLLKDAPRARPSAPPRPARTPPRRPEPRGRSRVVKGVSAALFAAIGGLLVVEAIALIIWMAEPRASAPLSAALRTGAAFWLLGHGGHLQLPAGTAALIPLGLTALFAAFLSRAGANVAKARPAALRRRTIVVSAGAVSVPYALTVALVARIASGGGMRPSVPTACIGALVLALACSAFGAARELPAPAPRPSRYRAVAAGVAAAGLALIAAAALLAGLALVTHISDAAALAKPAKAGAIGGLGLLALQGVLAPNAVVWSSTYLLGPGFSVGAHTLVSPTSAHLGDVPALPMLAGLPSSAGPWPVYLLFAIPVAAGAIGGAVVVRRLPRTPSLPLAALLGAAVALAMAAVTAVAAALSGGAVTRGRLATVGPSPWHNALAAFLEIGIPGTLAAVGLAWRRQQQVAMTYAAPPTGPWWLRTVHLAGALAGAGLARTRKAGTRVRLRTRRASSRVHVPALRREPTPTPKVDLVHHGRHPVLEPVTEPLPIVIVPLAIKVDLVKRSGPPPAAPAPDVTPVRQPKRFRPRLPARLRRGKTIKLPD